jgi:hypothetical protein
MAFMFHALSLTDRTVVSKCENRQETDTLDDASWFNPRLVRQAHFYRYVVNPRVH